MKHIPLIFLLLLCSFTQAETGYELWLRYVKVEAPEVLKQYQTQIRSITLLGNSETTDAIRSELTTALNGLLHKKIQFSSTIHATGSWIIGNTAHANLKNLLTVQERNQLGEEGFKILSQNNKHYILGNTDIAVLYGVFHWLRLLQTHQPITSLNIISTPRLKLRMLNHWDNLDRTVERGYAGFSIWDWHKLPGYINQRYIDYARANASIGINGITLTNVNANATILTPTYMAKVKALADAFRPYGIKVFLTARFSAPMELGKLPTADPLNPDVKLWWTNKINELYQYIPDFGGFVVKANSEGQPGPGDYKRTHADGANMLADAMGTHKGIVIWRAFVYAAENPDDRHKQAYTDFTPLDGKFRSNVMVQVKNGAIDFMPREPFHPLFGAMPKTPLMMEFQVTQEYLGQATNWVFLGPLFKEVLNSDTYAKGKGSTVAKIIDGSLDGHALSGMTGVANIGADINWTGHPMAQANWYALGRLAWDHELSSASIAQEWLRMTFSNNARFLQSITPVMLQSREILVNYMNPLGLHHIMGTGHHYGPAPWVANLNRPEWNPVYYHKADSNGIGFNRTSTGSNALAQYHKELQDRWGNANTCDETLLLWFHHLPWNFTMQNGKTLWNELCIRYEQGNKGVEWMRQQWSLQKEKVDEQRFRAVRLLLDVQQEEANWWRDACISYFQTFSKKSLPAGVPTPAHTLEYYQSLKFLYAPGNGTN